MHLYAGLTHKHWTLLMKVQAPYEEIPFFPTLSSAQPQPWLLGFSQAVSCLLDHSVLWGAMACRACRTETMWRECQTMYLPWWRFSKAWGATAAACQISLNKACSRNTDAWKHTFVQSIVPCLSQWNVWIVTNWGTCGRSRVYFLLCECRLTIMAWSISHTEEKCFWASAAASIDIYDLIQCVDKLSWDTAFGWRQAETKYNSKTKAFVSTYSILFVLAGYGGSLYEPWVNGVWGEA